MESYTNLEELSEEEVPLLNSSQPSRNSTLKTKFVGGFLAILACFIFTWVAYFVQTFGVNVSDIMLVRSVLQMVIFALVIKYWKLDFWLCRDHFESNTKYWLHCGMLIFQVSKKISHFFTVQQFFHFKILFFFFREYVQQAL